MMQMIAEVLLNASDFLFAVSAWIMNHFVLVAITCGSIFWALFIGTPIWRRFRKR